jgi:hypothetical protein
MRAVPRWLAVSAVIAIASLACAYTVHRVLRPSALELQVSATLLPADGFSSAKLQIRTSRGGDLAGLRVEIDQPHRAALDSLVVGQGSAMASVRSGVLPGELKVRVAAPGYIPREVVLRTTLDGSDSVGDGTPDFLRLHDAADRAAFRRWFTLLAESQYYRGKALPAEIDDCASLLRFAYREALREHDTAWAKAMELPVAGSATEVRQYQFPFTPVGASLFRVRSGSFEEANLRDGAFGEFADAETLWRYNTFRVARDLGWARPGDLLFFRQEGHAMPFHAMIFLGRSQVEPGREEFVVYHTGPSGRSPGEVRRLSVAQLLNHPEARWHPVASNPNFLGIYRWNILRGTD